MNRPARPLRRTVLMVAGIHLALILGLGLPFATCSKPKKIQPVEIVDLGSLRPGPGSPAPPVATPDQTASPSSPALQETPQPTPQPEEVKEPVPESSAETPIPPKPQLNPQLTPAPKKKLPKPETPAPTSNAQPAISKKHEVKVSTVRKKVADSSSEPKAGPKSPPGPTAAEIKSRLSSAIPGEAPGSGGDGAGMAGRPDGIADDFSWYRALIKQTVQAKWKKPPIPSGEKIITEVAIRITPDGSVTFLNLSKPSGDAAMDASVETAVRAAAKIPRPLPVGLGTPDYTVIIQFKLE